MVMFRSPEEHKANPPETWLVVLVGRKYQLCLKGGNTVLGTFTTKRDASAARIGGEWVDLYRKEGRWYAGDTPDGWKPYDPADGTAHTPDPFDLSGRFLTSRLDQDLSSLADQLTAIQALYADGHHGAVSQELTVLIQQAVRAATVASSLEALASIRTAVQGKQATA